MNFQCMNSVNFAAATAHNLINQRPIRPYLWIWYVCYFKQLITSTVIRIVKRDSSNRNGEKARTNERGQRFIRATKGAKALYGIMP